MQNSLLISISLCCHVLIMAMAPDAAAQDNIGLQANDEKTIDILNDIQRMDWWREARFGLFIHWGIYSVSEGEWKGKTNYAEWIRHKGQIPLADYDKLRSEFNPTNYDPDQWALMAKNAGMKYLVITSKHHDGFCLWPSKQTDFDIENTPYKKDLLGPLKTACEKQDVKLCFYHSIMDWHHPDYIPLRKWEIKKGSSENANFDNYVHYMKKQLKELIDNYGPVGVIWFDGEWENTWNHQYGKELYTYVRGLQPDIIINNRVDKGRQGMAGFSKQDDQVQYSGDFGTPEQEIPATGVPGVDWETCMTMNSHWGWNKHDKKWKSTSDLVRKLIEVSSKGGNFLLNVGPKPDGTFPQQAIERLEGIGKWMEVNGESIHGTSASPFADLAWGRCTKKFHANKTTLYLHVIDWPAKKQLTIPKLGCEINKAYLLADKTASLDFNCDDKSCFIELPQQAPDDIASVIVVELDRQL